MNRLSKETSPYLKQHENNPVDWYPWGEEALTRARAENKPILLSVGYSSCHWCHVMAHESFESPQIAALMNEHFVCVKVDREERPDLDMIYQPVAQVFTRGGGWPLTVFLTPDLKPFYGGTYFPPSDKYGRPGFPKVLLALVKNFTESRAEVDVRAEKITEVIRTTGEVGRLDEKIDATGIASELGLREGLLNAAQTLVEYIDQKNGGIGAAPKFPNTSALTFLWRMSLNSWVTDLDRRRFREGVLLSLDHMACGGIFDQIGGGFHRYSVDAEWVIPHFEKMLYDNGLLLKLYSEVLLQADGLSLVRTALYSRVLEKTTEWLEREMRSTEGLFYSALDADSMNAAGHLEEGAYYTWAEDEFSSDEFRQLLTGTTEEGRHALTLQNFPVDAVASPDIYILLDQLGAIRGKRARPDLDDKVLVSWTSLAISGLAWTSMAFDSLGDEVMAEKSRVLATEAWNSLKSCAFNASGEMFSTVQKGKPKFTAYLDDEAFFLQCSLDLARADHGNAWKYFEFVEKRIPLAIQNYHDPEKLGFFFTKNTAKNASGEALIHRPKNFYDQAIPSGNGVMLAVLIAMESSHVAADFSYVIKSQELDVFQNGFGMSEILTAMLLKTVGPVKVEGEPELGVRSHPFCFWVKQPKSGATTQYCVGQTCHSGAFDPKKYF